MYGYKIRFGSLPESVWACETTVKDYSWKNRNGKDVIEISLSSFSKKTVIVNENTYTLHGNALACVVGNDKVRAFCEKGSSITITSVASRFSDLEYEKCEFRDSDFEDESVLLLASVPNPPASLNLYAVKALHNMIKYNSRPTEVMKKAFSSEFLKLMCEIDKSVRMSIKESKTNYYVKKINWLIDRHYREKITLEQIAKELNLSPVYISAVYKASTGITFSQQLLNVRMSNAEKLLVNPNLPTARIAELCGFCDESYFRKTFKKFFKINIKDYRNIKNGVTLYHDSPVKSSEDGEDF